MKRLLVWICTLFFANATLTPVAIAGAADEWIRRFADSDIVFQRSESNAPFPPIAFASTAYYSDSELSTDNGRTLLKFDISTLSQAAGIPLLLGKKDVFAAGEWISLTRFRATDQDKVTGSFDVLSIGLPVGWLRQANQDWQVMGFVMPLGHKASLPRASWTYEYMGGIFGRYTTNENLWWAFGAFADISAGEDDLYLPYLGASWVISPKWTLSAILPWPAVLFSPTRDTLFRFGASPSGASWSLQTNRNDLTFNLDTWDLGVSAEHRIGGGFWARLTAGIGGLRGLRIGEGGIDTPDIAADSSTFIRLGIDYRPGLTD